MRRSFTFEATTALLPRLLLGLLVALGSACGVRVVPASGPLPPAETLPPAPAALTSPAAPSPGEPGNRGRGIKVLSQRTLYTTAGDKKNGVFLTGRLVDAVHLCDGEPITEFMLESPRWGSTKTSGTGDPGGAGHHRYFPPSRPCVDLLPVTLRARDGCEARVGLQVVVKGGG